MNRGPLEPVYRSKLPFENSRIQAAAYCSDGRFGENVDDFLHNALHLPRHDRLSIPGGGTTGSDPGIQTKPWASICGNQATSTRLAALRRPRRVSYFEV